MLLDARLSLKSVMSSKSPSVLTENVPSHPGCLQASVDQTALLKGHLFLISIYLFNYLCIPEIAVGCMMQVSEVGLTSMAFNVSSLQIFGYQPV